VATDCEDLVGTRRRLIEHPPQGAFAQHQPWGGEERVDVGPGQRPSVVGTGWLSPVSYLTVIAAEAGHPGTGHGTAVYLDTDPIPGVRKGGTIAQSAADTGLGSAIGWSLRMG
jgi:hypothetical protein